jgi:hypothetical protein
MTAWGVEHESIRAMRRLLPHSLAFLALHVLFIGTAIAVAAFN